MHAISSAHRTTKFGVEKNPENRKKTKVIAFYHCAWVVSTPHLSYYIGILATLQHNKDYPPVLSSTLQEAPAKPAKKKASCVPAHHDHPVLNQRVDMSSSGKYSVRTTSKWWTKSSARAWIPASTALQCRSPHSCYSMFKTIRSQRKTRRLIQARLNGIIDGRIFFFYIYRKGALVIREARNMWKIIWSNPKENTVSG